MRKFNLKKRQLHFLRPLFLSFQMYTSFSLSSARYCEGGQSMPDSSHRCSIERCVRDCTASVARTEPRSKLSAVSAVSSVRLGATRVIKWYK